MENSFKVKHSKLLHTSFEVGLLIKGVDGILEIIGGFLLLYFNPARLNGLVHFLTQNELSEDPGDIVANTLIKISSGFSFNAQSFGVFYLMTHGAIKCLIVFLLWRKKIWAYPVSITALVLFIVYQIYRYILSPSFLLILLTLLDIIMIILTYIEYQRMKLNHTIG